MTEQDRVGMGCVMKALYRIHGELVSRVFVLGGGERDGHVLRFVRFLIDLGEMGRLHGLDGIVEVIRDRLRPT